MPDLIGYSRLVRDALRQVVRQALLRVAEQGLPGGHHFYIGFDTGHPGVRLPVELKRRYPTEVTIVLQHQFQALVVEEEAFAVTLRFDGRPARLRVPFDALLTFVDPEAELGLSFRPPGEEGVAASPGEEEPEAEELPPNVVSFRVPPGDDA